MRTLLIALLMTATVVAQNTSTMELPFKQIPDTQEEYQAGNIVKRMVDGLGYRYYWATEGLRPEDLTHKPSEDARSSRETLEHLFGLSETISNAAQKKANIRPADYSKMSFEELRRGTLEHLQRASELYANLNAKEVQELQVIFEFNGQRREFPFWNMLNGPIADALYHTGQIVSFRRASGNPMNPKVNVFMGRNNE